MTKKQTLTAYHKTNLGTVYHADSLDVMKAMKPDSVDLIMTSPPFGLTREKEYGNVREQAYLDWFKPFAKAFHRILKDSGSLVIDIGGAWKPGHPVRSLYHFKLLIMLCEEFGFHLAQDFYWWNPSKLPTPAEWVNIRRIRVKGRNQHRLVVVKKPNGPAPAIGAYCNPTARAWRRCWRTVIRLKNARQVTISAPISA